MAAGDIAIAHDLTKALAIGHVVVDQPASRLATEWRSNIETEFASADAMWMLAVADFLKGKVRYIYDGIGGDVLSAGLFLTREGLEIVEADRLEELAQIFLGAASTDRQLTTDARRRLESEVAIRRVIQALNRHADAPNPTASVRVW